LPLCTTGTFTEVIRGSRESLGVADISLTAQQLPSFDPARTLLSASQKAPEVSDFWCSELLEGTTPLAKDIQLPHLGCGVLPLASPVVLIS